MLPGKNGITVLMLDLKKAEIKAEDVPLHMYQGHKATKHVKCKDETPILMVHAGHINKTKKLCLPTEE